MDEPTFTDGGFGWRSHRLNEPEQITDKRILQTEDEMIHLVQTAHENQLTCVISSRVSWCLTYCEFGSILDQQSFESVKCRFFFSKVDDKLSWKNTADQDNSEVS